MSAHFVRAAEEGKLEKVRELLNRGTPVDWHSKARGFTALTEAALRGHLEVARLLLERGANPNHVVPENGATPLHYACQTRPVAVQMLLVELLLESGADPNRADLPWNVTPLMAASHEGNLEVVRRLLTAGADPHAQTKDGRTALDFARTGRKEAVIALLEAVGASPAPPKREPTPLPWPSGAAEGTDHSTPEAALYGFIAAMHRFEQEAARIFKSKQTDAWDRIREAMDGVFARHCTPKPRPLGRNGSFNTPPEYDPEEEVLLESTLEQPRRAVVITQNRRLDRENRYVLLKRGGRWLLDNKKIRSPGGDWLPWSL